MRKRIFGHNIKGYRPPWQFLHDIIPLRVSNFKFRYVTKERHAKLNKMWKKVARWYGIVGRWTNTSFNEQTVKEFFSLFKAFVYLLGDVCSIIYYDPCCSSVWFCSTSLYTIH